MNKRTAIGFMTAAFVLISTTTRAATYVSPDGNFSFDLPTDGELKENKNPPAPATATWATADNDARLVFVVRAVSTNEELDKSTWEAVSLKPFPAGKILSSTQRKLNGVTIFDIEVQAGDHLFVEQNIAVFNDTSYKTMALSDRMRVSADPRFAGVFQTVQLHNVVSKPARLSRSDQNKISVNIAELGFGVLAVAGVVALVLRQARRSSAPGSSPPAVPHRDEP